MALLETFIAEPPPLRRDETGTVRVGGTRVTLDSVIDAYNSGRSPEHMVQSYDTLSLADVHAVISYYLRHRDEVDVYLKRRAQEAQELRQRIEAHSPPNPDFRERLLARRAEKRGKAPSP